ncbi:MAG: UDP-N-acetylmuramoyl-tripeptide--D-alanyl-D-alanine ligase [bacterium]
MSYALTQIAQAVDADLQGADINVSAVSTDTRTLKPGDLYVALKGERFDGHDYLSNAEQAGASALMVSTEVVSSLPRLKVDDTRLGLGKVGAFWRKQANARVVGITGSNGKTTVKEMVAAVLAVSHSVLATRGNLNNDIGMPLTLTRISNEDYAVIEMGANHPGEIDYLTRIACPDVAVLNNAGRAHLEGFGSLDGVAKAKGEIFNGLSNQGVCVFNADDRYADLWRGYCGARRQMTFGTVAEADVRGDLDNVELRWSEDRFHVEFNVVTSAETFQLQLQLAGRHNQMNALAATAACLSLGISSGDIQTGLAAMKPVRGRLCALSGINHSRLIDDSYNANPDSVAAAIEVLRTAPGQRFLVLGDLGELGENAAELHQQIGQLAREQGIDHLYSCGPLSAQAVESFGQSGKSFDDQASLLEALKAVIATGDTLLIKGSRAAAMDKVVDALHREDVAC